MDTYTICYRLMQRNGVSRVIRKTFKNYNKAYDFARHKECDARVLNVNGWHNETIDGDRYSFRFL